MNNPSTSKLSTITALLASLIHLHDATAADVTAAGDAIRVATTAAERAAVEPNPDTRALLEFVTKERIEAAERFIAEAEIHRAAVNETLAAILNLGKGLAESAE